MYAAGHAEVTESVSTIVEMLGKETLTSDAPADWNPGMLCP